MEDWVTIRNIKKRNPKLGTREIAKLLGISRNTVRSALRSKEVPKYDRPSKINPHIVSFVDYIYEKIVVKKLRGSYVLESIQAKGYRGSRSAFYRHVSKLKQGVKKIYKPYETGPAEQAQFDWSPYTVMMAGKLTRVYVFCYLLSFSRYRIYSASLSDTQGSVLEALEYGLRSTGGVPHRIQTDNAKVFVVNASKHNLVWNPRYLNFCGHYGFTPTRSLPGHPWSKGKVESPFFYLETHFIADHAFDSFEHFYIELSTFQEKVNHRIHATTGVAPVELYQNEKEHLLALHSSKYVDIKEEVRKASSDCLISFKGNKYSVPHLFASREVWVRVSQGCYLQIYSSRAKLIATHTLSTTKGQVLINHEHYRNHRIERGSWERLCHSFAKRFPEQVWFTEKLKTQKRINPAYHLTQILHLAHYYSPQDMHIAFEKAREYNAYNYAFIQGVVENAEVLSDIPASNIHAWTQVDIPQADIKRNLDHYQLKLL